jgi:hypothetical protein
MMKKFLIVILIISAVMISSCGKEEKPKPQFPTKRSAVKNPLSVDEKKVARKTEQPKPAKVTKEKKGNIQSIKISATVNKKKNKYVYWDKDMLPDIYGFVEFPDGNVAAFPLKENSLTNTAYAENITLNKGDTVRVVLRDKDIGGYEEIANGAFVYNGKTSFKKKSRFVTLTFKIKRQKK